MIHKNPYFKSGVAGLLRIDDEGKIQVVRTDTTLDGCAILTKEDDDDTCTYDRDCSLLYSFFPSFDYDSVQRVNCPNGFKDCRKYCKEDNCNIVDGQGRYVELDGMTIEYLNDTPSLDAFTLSCSDTRVFEDPPSYGYCNPKPVKPVLPCAFHVVGSHSGSSVHDVDIKGLIGEDFGVARTIFRDGREILTRCDMKDPITKKCLVIFNGTEDGDPYCEDDYEHESEALSFISEPFYYYEEPAMCPNEDDEGCKRLYTDGGEEGFFVVDAEGRVVYYNGLIMSYLDDEVSVDDFAADNKCHKLKPPAQSPCGVESSSNPSSSVEQDLSAASATVVTLSLLVASFIVLLF